MTSDHAKLYDVDQIGGKMYLRDKLDLFGFIQNGVYEPDETKIVKDIVKHKMTCVDVGANIGYFSILMAKQGAYVYAYEPEFENYKLLLENIVENGVEEVVLPLMHAVGNMSCVRTLYLSAIGRNNANYGMHRLYPSKWCDKTTPVHVVKLDEDIPKDVQIDFVKMDIEGSEYSALIGMLDLLETWHPKLMIEFHPSTLIEAGSDPAYVYRLLDGHSYDIFLIPDLDKPVTYEELWKRTDIEGGGRNILCV